MALIENPDPQDLINFLKELHSKLYVCEDIYKQEYGTLCLEIPPVQEMIEELVSEIKKTLT